MTKQTFAAELIDGEEALIHLEEVDETLDDRMRLPRTLIVDGSLVPDGSIDLSKIQLGKVWQYDISIPSEKRFLYGHRLGLANMRAALKAAWSRLDEIGLMPGARPVKVTKWV